MKNAGGGATAVAQPAVVASDTGGGSAAADSEDDEQWDTGKLVIDLEACQDAAGANHRPEASDSTAAAVAAPASTEKVAATTAVTVTAVSGEPTAAEGSSSSTAAPPPPSKLAAAAGVGDTGSGKEKPAKLKTKRKSTKKSSGSGGAGSAPKAESNCAASGKKERSSGKKKASGSRASGTGSRSAASTPADKRDGAKAASRKKKDRPPSSVCRGGGAARESSAVGKVTAAIPVAAANASRASSVASKVAAGSPSAAGADNSQPDSPLQRCSNKRIKVDVPTSSAASGTAAGPIVTTAAAGGAHAAAGLTLGAVAPATRCRDAATDTAESSHNSVAVATEPDCLGPCEPGTHVSLDGIVWQETSNGVLVVNVTWRSKTYVGALLDATKHDWAPPRLQSDSPTSDMDSRAPKSRGTTKRRLPQSSAFQDINERKLRQQGRRSSMQQQPLPPPSPARSEAGSAGGGAGGKRKSSRCAAAAAAAAAGGGCLTEPPPTPSSETASDPEASATLAGVPPPAKRRRTSSRCSAGGGSCQSAAAVEGGDEEEGSGTKQPAAATPPAAPPLLPPPPAPQYIECPEPNCSKKYKNVSGLRYHQSHAHGLNSEASRSPPLPSAAVPDSLVAAAAVVQDSSSSAAAVAATAFAGATMLGAGKWTASGSSFSASPVSTASVAADESEPGSRLPPPTLLRVSTLRSGIGPPSISGGGCGGAEQLEPTDLSFAVRKPAVGAGFTLPARAPQLFGGSERIVAATDLPAPKLEPVDCLESVAMSTATVSRRTLNTGSDAVPPSLAASAATAVPQQLTLGSANAPSPSSGGGSGGSSGMLFGSAGGSLQLLSAGVPVAAITPQVVKPSSSSSATSSLGLLTLGSVPATTISDTRTLTAPQQQQHATGSGTKPKAGVGSLSVNGALHTPTSRGGGSSSSSASGSSTQPKLLPRGSSGSTKSGSSSSATGTGTGGSCSALGSLAAVAAAASCMPSSGVGHPASGTLSLKPIQPKPTILGDPRPAVPLALSDLREQKRRDHRAEKASRRSHQQQRSSGGTSSNDSGPPPLKAEQRSPPLLSAGGSSAAVWSATASSDSQQQHPSRAGAQWTAPQQLPNSDREDGCTAADRVASTAEQLVASCHQPAGSPAPGVNGLPTGSASTWDALPKLKPSRLGAPVVAGVVVGGGSCADSLCNKSPAAYSDISSDDSSSERPVGFAAPSVTVSAVGPASSSSGSSDSPLSRGGCSVAAAAVSPAVSQQSAGGSGAGHVTVAAASAAAAPLSHHLFSSGLSSSSQPVATVSPRKVVMELPPPLQRGCTIDDSGADRLYETGSMPISSGKEAASAMQVVGRAAESDAETFGLQHQHRKLAVVPSDEQLQPLLARHSFDGQHLARSQQSHYAAAVPPPPAYWPPPTHGVDAAPIDWSPHASKESATAAPAKPATAQRHTPDPPHHRAGSAASSRSGTLSSSPSRPSASDQSASGRSASSSTSGGGYAKSGGGPGSRDGGACLDSKAQALLLLPSASRATGASAEGEHREHRRLLQQLPLREDASRSGEDGSLAAAVAHSTATGSSSRKHSHGGTRHSPGSLVAKSVNGDRDEAGGGGERRNGTAAGDLVRQPRFSPSPSAMAAAAAAAAAAAGPQLHMYGYPPFSLPQGYPPALPFDQRGSPAVEPSAMLASLFSFLPSNLFMDPRAAAGLPAVESREAVSNGSAAGSLAAGLPSPATSGLYGGPKGHQQPHKIHELEDPQPPLLPPPLRSASAAAQKTGGGGSRSSGVAAAACAGSSSSSFLSETVQGNRPPSRASPVGGLGIVAAGLAPSASIFGPLSAAAGQGLSQFLPKP